LVHDVQAAAVFPAAFAASDEVAFSPPGVPDPEEEAPDTPEVTEAMLFCKSLKLQRNESKVFADSAVAGEAPRVPSPLSRARPTLVGLGAGILPTQRLG